MLKVLDGAEGAHFISTSSLKNGQGLGDTTGGQKNLAVLKNLAIVQGDGLLGDIEIRDGDTSQELDSALGGLNLLQVLLVQGVDLLFALENNAENNGG